MTLLGFFDDRQEISDRLDALGELSLFNTYATDLPRIFIVAAASSFEVQITNQIVAFYREVSTHASAAEFVERKALKRTYHTLFSWDGPNVNSFTVLFGPACSAHYRELLTRNVWLEAAAKSFLKLGQARNELVHGDFSTVSPSMTAAEVRVEYEAALRFVNAIPHIIRLEEII